MMISDVSRTNCLIVGAGALGLLIAAAIKKSQQSDGKNGYVGVFNRRLLPVPVTVQLPDGENVDMTSCLNTEIPDWFAHSSARRIVFFCLPPESTEVVSLSFLNNAKAIFEASQNVTIVFCNNGCLPQSVISHLESEGFATLRALFFIGAVRQESSMGTCVSWTGGNRAVWNEIVSANPSPVVESQEVLQQLSFLLNSGERFVDWLRTDNIFAMERCKFFTNFILAAGIGRRKEKNKRLYSRLNSGTLDMTASQCARLWQSHGVNENDLKSVLLKTVAATEENFNSLSLAAVHGDDSTMRWFLSFLASEISNVADVADFVQLLKFIENVRDEWGI